MEEIVEQLSEHEHLEFDVMLSLTNFGNMVLKYPAGRRAAPFLVVISPLDLESERHVVIPLRGDRSEEEQMELARIMAKLLDATRVTFAAEVCATIIGNKPQPHMRAPPVKVEERIMCFGGLADGTWITASQRIVRNEKTGTILDLGPPETPNCPVGLPTGVTNLFNWTNLREDLYPEARRCVAAVLEAQTHSPYGQPPPFDGPERAD